MHLLLQLNPLTSFLNLLRQPILHAQVPDAATYLTATLTTLAVFGLAAFTLAPIAPPARLADCERPCRSRIPGRLLPRVKEKTNPSSRKSAKRRAT